MRTNKVTAKSGTKKSIRTGFAHVVGRIRENEADNLDAWCEAHEDYVRVSNETEGGVSASEYAKAAHKETGYAESSIRQYLGALDWAMETDARRKKIHTVWKSVRAIKTAMRLANAPTPAQVAKKEANRREKVIKALQKAGYERREAARIARVVESV
jgi:hypothetical protein